MTDPGGDGPPAEPRRGRAAGAPYRNLLHVVGTPAGPVLRARHPDEPFLYVRIDTDSTVPARHGTALETLPLTLILAPGAADVLRALERRDGPLRLRCRLVDAGSPRQPRHVALLDRRPHRAAKSDLRRAHLLLTGHVVRARREQKPDDPRATYRFLLLAGPAMHRVPLLPSLPISIDVVAKVRDEEDDRLRALLSPGAAVAVHGNLAPSDAPGRFSVLARRVVPNPAPGNDRA